MSNKVKFIRFKTNLLPSSLPTISPRYFTSICRRGRSTEDCTWDFFNGSGLEVFHIICIHIRWLELNWMTIHNWKKGGKTSVAACTRGREKSLCHWWNQHARSKPGEPSIWGGEKISVTRVGLETEVVINQCIRPKGRVNRRLK